MTSPTVDDHRKAVWVLGVGLLTAAVVTELRKPPEGRTWEGKIAGMVPYDLRPPTLERLRDKVWAPEGTLITPHGFGVGWSVNLGRIARRLGLA
ncbi:hypothetical protein E1269_24370 [Jiangella asiatica]|uniref:DUF5808 domain-containing protein n=1 Tax=Jiangella asiatica TaxID=2530372 RepID=A0A4R5CSZ9_9ACTN|nr:hypothetical protein E1269_24370 [Jiangella asiatica]